MISSTFFESDDCPAKWKDFSPSSPTSPPASSRVATAPTPAACASSAASRALSPASSRSETYCTSLYRGNRAATVMAMLTPESWRVSSSCGADTYQTSVIFELTLTGFRSAPPRPYDKAEAADLRVSQDQHIGRDISHDSLDTSKTCDLTALVGSDSDESEDPIQPITGRQRVQCLPLRRRMRLTIESDQRASARGWGSKHWQNQASSSQTRAFRLRDSSDTRVSSGGCVGIAYIVNKEPRPRGSVQ